MAEISKEDILLAKNRIEPYIHRTPILTSSYFNDITGCRLIFKCENFQKVGAFKARGGMNAALQLSMADRVKGVCTHSSGNHAQALAFAAKKLEIPAFIVMPANAPQVKVDAVKEYGAQIIFCNPGQENRENAVKKVMEETGAAFIHPFANYQVIAGQGTAALELIEDYPEVRNIITPVGGGGLLSGTCLAAHYFGKDVNVYGGEPEIVNDAQKSLQTGILQGPTGNKSVADGLLTSLGSENFTIIQRHCKGIYTVNEEEILQTLQEVYSRLKIVIEPSSAVPLAALIKNAERFKNGLTAVIFSGGNVQVNPVTI